MTPPGVVPSLLLSLFSDVHLFQTSDWPTFLLRVELELPPLGLPHDIACILGNIIFLNIIGLLAETEKKKKCTCGQDLKC